MFHLDKDCMTQTDSFLKSDSFKDRRGNYLQDLPLPDRREEGTRELSFPEHRAADLSALLFCCFYHEAGVGKGRG